MSKNYKIHNIWNSDIDPEDFREDYESDYLNEREHVSNDVLSAYAYELNNEYRYDEELNLSGIDTPNGCIAIAEVTRWNGTFHGFRDLPNIGNVGDLIALDWSGDDLRFYCSGRNVHLDTTDHDGGTHVIIRAWKPGITDEQKDRYMEKIYTKRDTPRDMTRYTYALAPAIKEVYGW